MTTTLNALKTFTTALGYDHDKTIFFRLITAKNFNINNDAHVKLLPGSTYLRDGVLVARQTNLAWNQATGEVLGYGDKVKSKDIISYLQSQSDLGMAIYIVVNPGGQSIPAITEARVIYYENDSHSIPEQVAKFNELNDRWGGGFAVKTRHSIHSYFRLESPITPPEFTDIQKRLIAYLPGSDPSIHDACRVMRVPGFDHIQIDNNIVTRTPIEMIHDWDGTYTNWTQIDLDLPEPEALKTNKVTLERTTMTNPSPENYPSLNCFLSIQNREYIKHGAVLGSRNTVAKTLASDLIGTARQLGSMGIPISDSADDLYLQYCDHCDTAQPGELEGIWDKTIKENPTPCLDIDKIVVNNKAHYARTFKDGINLNSGTLPSVSADGNYQSILAQELEYIEAKDIKPILVLGDAEAELWKKTKSIYPSDVVKSIEANSRKLGVKEYVYARAYDTLVSGMLNGKFSVKCDENWNEPLNIFTAIVGIPGVNKSHIIKWLSTPLTDKDEEYRAEYRAAKKQYRRDLSEYLVREKQDPNDTTNVEPDEPELKYASHGKSTHAKLIQALGTQKTCFNSASNIMIVDEMTTIFGGDEKTGVNTAELSLYLTGFTGGAVTSDTKCDGLQGVSKVMLSILTTTQPVTILMLAKKLSQSNGFMERLLTPKVRESDIKKYNWTLSETPTKPLGSHIEELYYTFDALEPNQLITFSPEARMTMLAVEDWVFEKKSLRAKPKSYIIRLAGLYAVYEDYRNPVIKSNHVIAAWDAMKMDEADKNELGINKEPQSVTEETVDRVIEILMDKGMVTAGKLGGQIYALRAVNIADRQLVIDKVAKFMGDKAKTETSPNGKSVLVLNSDYVPTIEPIPAPIQYVDETPIDTVQLKGSQISPIKEEPELELEPTLEVQLTQIEPLETTDTIYIPLANIPPKFQKDAPLDGIYQLLSTTDTYFNIEFSTDKSMSINRAFLE